MEGDQLRGAAEERWNLKDGETRTPIWVDCDTGHDDAFAVLLAAHCPRLNLLGVSTVHGNSSLENTTRNTLSILEAIGKRGVNVYPGTAKPFCRNAAYAPGIHGESGLDGTNILPVPAKDAMPVGSAVNAMYEALSKCPPKTAWLVSTGTLTNIGLLFAMYPSLAEHIAGLSIMGGAIGGFFAHAPIGRIRKRVPLSPNLGKLFPNGLFDDSMRMSIPELAAKFRDLGILDPSSISSLSDEELYSILETMRDSFGNTTHSAEFNIYCDPEAAASIFSNAILAAKTTLIPLDITHQVLANTEVMKLLSGNYNGGGAKLAGSALRHLFLEIMTFFAQTYEREFGMNDGPPLHDPIAVAAAFCPDLFDDNGGERFLVHVVKEGEETDKFTDGRRLTENVGDCGRTVARMLPRGVEGVKIPRRVNDLVFWRMIDFALGSAEAVSMLKFHGD